ncbi:hypothetical protein HDU87_005956 [Geranomyces variabilis]|uniref:AB hydrolase-1 domain-containing protein n=1 Tax=Geranomyces variabilis TaxID=109894 RepID=A0AAD5TQ89_9FUNG|nr:hypothetical protein HDU87_005956 [Geranomyces variabilis]
MTADLPTVLFVHGAWHGPGCWDAVRGILAARNITSHATVNSSAGSDPRLLTDMYADSENVVRTLADLSSRNVVLVGHSYGGCIITDAGADAANVKRLVYLAAYAPGAGQSLMTFSAKEVQQAQELFFDMNQEEGYCTVKPEFVIPKFYADVEPTLAQAAAAGVKLQAVAAFGQPVRAAAHTTKPATYIVATNDQCLAVEKQRRWAGAAGIADLVEIPTGHSPFYSHPELLADVLEKIVKDVAARD